MRICNLNFERNCFNKETNTLLKHAVPTIFKFTKKPKDVPHDCQVQPQSTVVADINNELADISCNNLTEQISFFQSYMPKDQCIDYGVQTVSTVDVQSTIAEKRTVDRP